MPAFVTNGPDIPESLLQAHEQGQVVFFCGAGISYPAGLPGFRGLVDRVYAELCTPRTDIEERAYESQRYDATLDQLERRILGQRLAVRTAVASILEPEWHREGATATHQALLQLAADRKGKVRLVSTNFDRIFHRVITQDKLDIPSYAAPLLPIPKPLRWHGVVHLHGLLPDSPDETALNRLVLTSGDFGLAYLTERWAARFVSELFRNYTVCFVGYSIDDPVLRYMMDALAADELLGENRTESYAFASFSGGDWERSLVNWKAKGVTPLLYEIPMDTEDHSMLHRTLREWANTYHNGVRGKEMIIAQHASKRPLAPSGSDSAVDLVLWALADGLAARHFADLDPVPPLEWLEPLTEAQFGHEDLSRFGVVPANRRDNKLSFSVIRRPSPYTHATWMSVADAGAYASRWDEVMYQLARWLTRHLGDPKLVLWLARQGGQLHERFASLVRSQLEYLDRLEHEGKLDELARVRAAAPKAVPGPLMRTLWRVLLSGRVKWYGHNFDLADWLHKFKLDGLTPTLRMELREILMPRVMLREPFRRGGEVDSRPPERIRELAEWDIVLSSDDVGSMLRDLQNNTAWRAALPELFQDSTVLLRDALDLMRELGGAEDKSDLSYIAQPSISKHEQNRGYRDWTALIELTRDAWLAMEQTNPSRAGRAVEDWWQEPYPLFKRLAFFAAAQSDVIAPREALGWLLAADQWWLWSGETKREAIRLLVVLALRLDAHQTAELEEAILQGPPRGMFKDDIDPEEWATRVDRAVWLRLAKVQAAGAVLGQAAKSRLDELTQRYPVWRLAEDESDEFSLWIGKGDERRESVATPRRRRELMQWLRQHPSLDHWQEDDWLLRCRDGFPTTACALCALAKEGEWPAERWRQALEAWAEDGLLRRSWRYMARVVGTAPDEALRALSWSLASWLRAQSKTFEGQEKLFFSLIDRLLGLEYEDDDHADDFLSQAINHPIGLATEALLRWWYRQEPKDSGGLTDEVRLLFTQLCDTSVQKFRHGRVLLAAHSIALFRVDTEWTRMHLQPLFDWNRSQVEATAAWEGFLWSPRFYGPMLEAIKRPFLETASHYGQLGEQGGRYAEFLTFLALDPGDAFTAGELAEATGTLPSEGLQSAAQAVTRALEAVGEQRGEYWRNRVLPYLRQVWPKSRDAKTLAVSERLGELCVAAREDFPNAVTALRLWLQPVEHPHFLIHRLKEAKLCEQFSSSALGFLDLVIGDDAQWLPRELKQCLDTIESADRALAQDSRFVRLSDLYRGRGMS